MRRVVLDSSVVVSAFRSKKGASSAVLGLVAAHYITPLATPPLFLEYEDVLKRPEQRSASGLSLIQVDDALAILAAVIEQAGVRFSWHPQLSDPNDEMVLEAAVNGRADVSLNQWIASAGAQKVGAVEAAADFLRQRAGTARPGDLLAMLARAPDRAPDPGDERPPSDTE